MVNLKEKPFYLNDEGIKWVEETIDSMSLEEKVGQLFVQLITNPAPEAIQSMIQTYYPGGLCLQKSDRDTIYEQCKISQEASRIPLLLTTNADNGGDGCIADGTFIATAAEAGAGQDSKTAYDIGYVAGRESARVGANWIFNPCADIYMNWRNTIINTRAFGDNAEDVIKHVRAYIDGLHQSNVACCCKHFPGDGVEERDQHLVLSVNDLSADEWNNTFRKVYQTLINDGIETIMAGHIALPEMSRKLRPGIKDHEIMPATLAPELLTDLLREEMGFNGVIITDASRMAGFTCMEKRSLAVPKCIASGCDVFLFSSDMEEDFQYMMDGVKNGIITEERLNDALHRILGLKAKLQLYKQENLIPEPSVKYEVIGCQEHLELAKEAAERCITLVKDTQQNLPINPEKQKRARLIFVSSTPITKAYKGDPVKQVVVEELERAGFAVDVAPNFHDLEVEHGPNPMNAITMMEYGKREDFASQYDVVFVFINLEGYAQENQVRLRWSCSHCSEVPWYVTELLTIGVSLNYTNHLIDVPQIHTFINAYSPTRTTIRAAIDKICGKSAFTGVASETVFCGKWDTRL